MGYTRQALMLESPLWQPQQGRGRNPNRTWILFIGTLNRGQNMSYMMVSKNWKPLWGVTIITRIRITVSDWIHVGAFYSNVHPYCGPWQPTWKDLGQLFKRQGGSVRALSEYLVGQHLLGCSAALVSLNCQNHHFLYL